MMNMKKIIKLFLAVTVIVITACKNELDVAVTGVSLDQTSLSLYVDDTQQLTYRVAPENATNKEVMWKSLSSDIASVSPEGLVTAKSAGTAEIYVIARDGNKAASCQVTVSILEVPTTGVTLNLQELMLERTDKVRLVATVLPAGATSKSVTWNSSNNEVAQVDNRGEITGVSEGTARITVTTVNGGFQAHCNVTVTPKIVPVSGVELPPTLTLGVVSNRKTLTASILPEFADNQELKWEIVEGKDVVSITEIDEKTVEVTALKQAGTAKITVTTLEGGFQASCTVTVDSEVDNYTYTVAETDNASAIASAIAEGLAIDKRNITILFEAGKTYNVNGRMDFPSGGDVYNVHFVGAPGSVQPQVNFRVRINNNQLNDISFRNLKIDVQGTGNYLLESAGNSTHRDFILEDCYIFNLRSVYRADLTAGNSVSMNNCWVHDHGTYGVFSVRNTSTLNSITVTNSTFTEIRTYFSEINSETEITLRNLTICNIYYVTVADGDRWASFFRFGDPPYGPLTIEKCIIAGQMANENGGVPINATRSAYSGLSYSFAGSYKTNDWTEGDRKFTGIAETPYSASDLFVDPLNGNFRIKSTANFAGKGIAGDPRWY